MKGVYILLLAVALAFVVWDFIMNTVDIFTWLMALEAVALVIFVVIVEKREQQS